MNLFDTDWIRSKPNWGHLKKQIILCSCMNWFSRTFLKSSQRFSEGSATRSSNIFKTISETALQPQVTLVVSEVNDQATTFLSWSMLIYHIYFYAVCAIILKCKHHVVCLFLLFNKIESQFTWQDVMEANNKIQK